MPNIRLTLVYDGTRYCGWQVQKNGPSIQAALERAIEKLTGEKCPVYSAGRTDSGVHAIGQVANFHTASTIPAKNWRAALQAFLPDDIVIRDAGEVPDEFHATYSAKKKRYRYVIHNGSTSLPFLRSYVHHVRRPLAAAAMHAAGQVLLGTHDFRSFETDWPNKATSVRTVLEVTVSRRAGWDVWADTLPTTPSPPLPFSSFPPPPFLCLDIVADGFLYNMVRSIVGTLINVGRGAWTAADVARILEAKNRSIAGNTAPACGLYLVHVDYDEPRFYSEGVSQHSPGCARSARDPGLCCQTPLG